jgi:hypothetical protein
MIPFFSIVPEANCDSMVVLIYQVICFEKVFSMLDRVEIKDDGLWRLTLGHKPKRLSSL